MEFSIVIVLIITVTCSFAKDWPIYTKLDACSCHLTGVENPGIINLHSLVNGKHEPAFIIERKSNHTNLYYNFSYNPCLVSLTLAAQKLVYGNTSVFTQSLPCNYLVCNSNSLPWDLCMTTDSIKCYRGTQA